MAALLVVTVCPAQVLLERCIFSWVILDGDTHTTACASTHTGSLEQQYFSERVQSRTRFSIKPLKLQHKGPRRALDFWSLLMSG